MKKLIAFLLLIIAALQYRLWLGDGGIRELYEMQVHIEELKREGERRQVRNDALEADVMDLKEGTDAIEERARRDLGMIREGETFVQVFDKPAPKRPKPAKAKTPSAKRQAKPRKRSRKHP